jgi:hypothetical protein
MPDAAWQQRVDEWTPEVPARGWARAITDQAEGNATRDVPLVAEDDSGVLSALVSGTGPGVLLGFPFSRLGSSNNLSPERRCVTTGSSQIPG